ncbi:MAG: glycosyl transferase family 28 [Bacteroidetes bacterium]|nr:glycosyl transferase family 28 [Bacteroidota bacterium]
MNTSWPRVLVAPLNWGLGHATRCIPIIHWLLKQNCQVIIGANGKAGTLLQQEFPALPYVETPGTEIRYSQNKILFPLLLLWQMPKFLKQIRDEKRWLAKQVAQWKLDAVIADNRYGLHNPSIHSVLITHQLLIKTGQGVWVDRLLQKIGYRLLNKFNEVWIPDYRGSWALAGELSTPLALPTTPLRYIGILNRFSQNTPATIGETHLLFLLSGPEPQREILETLITQSLTNYTGSYTLVKGKPVNAGDHISSSTDSLQLLYGKSKGIIYEHLNSAALQTEIDKASLIICRSGYTSLMELLPQQKKLVCIPTPGQPEQEYLANYCNQKGWAPLLMQENFSIKSALTIAAEFSYQPYTPPPLALQQTLDPWLKTLLGKNS